MSVGTVGANSRVVDTTINTDFPKIVTTTINTTSFNNGFHTLAQLSTAAVYGFTCWESVYCLAPPSLGECSDESCYESRPYLVRDSYLWNHESPREHFEKHLVQLSPEGAIGAAIDVGNKRVGCYSTKYESDLLSSGDIRCSGIYNELCLDDYGRLSNSEEIMTIVRFRDRITKLIDFANRKLSFKKFSGEDISRCSIHPLYQVVHAKNIEDIIPLYHEKMEEIMALPMLPPPGIKSSNPLSSEAILHYRDPLYFLRPGYALCNVEMSSYSDLTDSIIDPFITFNEILLGDVNELIVDLEASVGKISRKLHNLILAVLLQVKYNIDLLISLSYRRGTPRAHSVYCNRETDAILSLDMIVSLRKNIKFIDSIKEILMPSLELGNFISLEDVMGILRNRISDSATHISTSDLKISSISLSLGTKYRELVVKKRMRIDYLLGKIDLNNVDAGKISSFLKMPYSCTVANKEIIIEELLRKIDLSNKETLLKIDYLCPIEQSEGSDSDEEKKSNDDDCKLVFVRSIIESAKKLMIEVEEMESFIKSLPE
ncbi:hypothetical protein [Candidatus Ichthyocystis hellenicum]|uniref:hypothetical protein n=1 Tax=Candidatus Ichthyocystis hellenicum TaxID=1561003 RepID=UPI000B88A5C2|nr:hypothetical protein [Candidatus Ichthyocystis hellenicum]